MYAHALTFMGTAAWALQRQAHVRVDIFYQNLLRVKKSLSGYIGPSIVAVADVRVFRLEQLGLCGQFLGCARNLR